MNELNEFLKLMADGKKTDPVAIKNKELKQNIKEDLGGLFSQLSSLKAEDPKAQQSKKIEAQVHEGVKADLGSLFAELASLKNKKDEILEEHPELVEQEITPIVEELLVEVSPVNTPIGEVPAEQQEPTIADLPAIDKYLKSPQFQEPEKPSIDAGREINLINNKMKFLEQWIGKIQNTGPGSGEVNFRYLDDVNRITMTPSNDNWILEYDASTKKVQFTEHVGPIRSVKLNTAGPQTALVAGQIAWNADEDCLDIKHSDGTILQTGLEQYIRVHNHTAETMVNGTVVMFAGVENTNEVAMPIIAKYVANSVATPLFIIGVLTSDIAANGIGRATTMGYVRNLNTTGSDVGETWAQGDLLWAHPSQAGKMTKVRPSAPNVATSIAAVARLSATDGQLLVRPTIWPRLFYGDWYDTTNQLAAANNTAYLVKMNSSGAVSGFELNNNGTQIKALNAGRYNFEFSLQFTSSNASSSKIYLWYRKNGVDVPHSNTVLTIAANGGKLAPAWNFPVLMNANDTFSLVWATDSTSVSLSAEPALAFCPSIPSVILTVSQTNL